MSREKSQSEYGSIPSTPKEVKEEIWYDLPKSSKYITAAVIYYGNITLGCALTSFGPSLTSFETKYGTDDATISKVFTINIACYLVGGLTGGFIYNYVNRQLAVIFTFAVMSATVFLIPLCPNLAVFFVAAGILGLCGGFYDTAQFVWIPEMMQKDCAPFVQGQHFFFALGTNLAGIILAPFLGGHEEENLNLNDRPPQLFTPYVIMGSMIIIAMISQQLLYIFMPYYPPPPEEQGKCQNSTDEEKIVDTGAATTQLSSKKWPKAKLRLVILLCCFFGACLSMELSTFQFFPKFAQNSDLHLSQSESAYLLTGMTAAYAGTRAIGIVAVLKVPPQLLLCVNIIIVFIANILLVGWAQNSLPILWTSSILFGVGFATSMASFTAFIERYLIFNNAVGSMITVSGSTVAAIYPLIIGSFIEHHPTILCYTTFLSITVIAIVVAISSYLTYKDKNRY